MIPEGCGCSRKGQLVGCTAVCGLLFLVIVAEDVWSGVSIHRLSPVAALCALPAVAVATPPRRPSVLPSSILPPPQPKWVLDASARRPYDAAAWARALQASTDPGYVDVFYTKLARVLSKTWHQENHGIVNHAFAHSFRARRESYPWTINLRSDNCTWQPVLDWERVANASGVDRRSARFRAAPLVNIVWPCFPHLLVTAAQRPLLDRVRGPLVIFADGGDSNWGLLSTNFPNRTIQWGSLAATVRAQTCRGANATVTRPCVVGDILAFLSDPRIIAMFATLHTNLTHPKLYNYPLSTGYEAVALTAPLEATLPDALVRREPRTEFLTNGNSGWDWRTRLNAHLAERFNITNARLRMDEYVPRLLRTKMYISPTGLGADCYRNMEMAVAGVVPVFERGFGLERAWARLPAVWVDDYFTMTRAQLQQAWAEIVYNVPTYRFEVLTMRFWEDDVLGRVCATANASFLDRYFPQPLPAFQYTRH